MSFTLEKDKSNTLWSYVLFVIWPFMAFISSVRNFSYHYAKNIIVFFYGLFGFTFIYSETSDSFRHAITFESAANRPFVEFFEIVSGLYSEDGQKPDIFMDFIAFVVSRFTNDSRFFFMALGLILSWMLMKNIDLFNKLYAKKKTTIGLIFLVFLFVLIPPSRILSFRHYLASMVYLFAVYQYFTTKKPIFLIAIACSVFVHFGFLLVVALFFVYKYIGKSRNNIYYVLIILSFFFAEQASAVIRQFGVGLDIGVDKVVNGYTNEKYLQRVSEYQENRVGIINVYIRLTTLFMFFSILYHKFRNKFFDAISEQLYSFALLIFAFVNFTQGLESITNRFSIVFQLLTCVFYIHLYTNNEVKKSNIFKYTSIGFLLLNFVILTRITIEYANIVMVTPLLPLSFLTDSQTTILDFIK
ncbi:MAG: hypothetical protein CFE23_03375 [Flavobacterium sp. BFFFF1]|uniref:EpsG family protein n=1 Tax=unclassified Flavobacterium TaxID=196869 RepID=UPI000BD41765|nr:MULTISPECIES: EpsG family protein [unclassified Flavobacterium]OYU81520.1 MAG: hypothetical protein CFE23_03375 [Flavobacterium sp. BFFFF1]